MDVTAHGSSSCTCKRHISCTMPIQFVLMLSILISPSCLFSSSCRPVNLYILDLSGVQSMTLATGTDICKPPASSYPAPISMESNLKRMRGIGTICHFICFIQFSKKSTVFSDLFSFPCSVRACVERILLIIGTTNP